MCMKSDPIKDFGYKPYQVERYSSYIGTTVGKWKIIDFAPKSKSKCVRLLCECQCEYHTVRNIDVYDLIRGKSKSCRSCARTLSDEQKASNDKKLLEKLIGKTFGRWKVIDTAPRYVWDGEERTQMLCECQCENKTVKAVRLDHLKKGISTSCGCLKSELSFDRINKSKPWELHGQRKGLTYIDQGSYMVGFTSKEEPFYFDPEDFDLFKDTTWLKHQCGRICGHYYNSTTLTFVTDLLLRRYNGYRYSFKNKNPMDYRKENFIMETVPRPKGVYFNKNHQKWHVRVTQSGRRRTVGYYDDIQEAIAALERAKAGLF